MHTVAQEKTETEKGRGVRVREERRTKLEKGDRERRGRGNEKMTRREGRKGEE